MVYNKISIFGWFDIYLYGICIAVGLIIGFFILRLLSDKYKISRNSQYFFEILAIISIAIGFLSATLFQAVYEWIESGFKSFNFNSGMTFLGGLIGGVAVFLLGVKFVAPEATKKEFPKLLEVAPAVICVAHGFGRIGCVFAGCCHGNESEHGIYFSAPGGNSNLAGRYVPTNLYEALFLFALFGAIMLLIYYKKFKYNMATYLIAYGIFRFIIEFYRERAALGELLGFITPSQTWSLVMIIIGVTMIIYRIYKKKKDGEDEPDEPDEEEKIEELSRPLAR